MSLSARAILARFEFDKKKAIQYCKSLARMYPNLREEYLGYAETIKNTDTSQLEEANG